MTAFLFLIAAIGLLPLLIGLTLMGRRLAPFAWQQTLASTLVCALSFNLTFFWQELWLVIPKALTPGLHPVLFHNDHDWTGTAPIAELLQGCGAIATFVMGTGCALLLAKRQPRGRTMRHFCFWMAFEGLNQALTQLAIGSIIPGNDVGRALTYLDVGQAGHVALLALTFVALALSGRIVASLFMRASLGNASAGAGIVLASALLSVILVVPFRVPRSPIETTLIPFTINLVGAGWTLIGFAREKRDEPRDAPAVISWVSPALWLCLLLAIFQLVLRPPGIRF